MSPSKLFFTSINKYNETFEIHFSKTSKLFVYQAKLQINVNILDLQCVCTE